MTHSAPLPEQGVNPIKSEVELRHLEEAVHFQVQILELKGLQHEARARTIPNMYDPGLVHLREELATAWREYRIAQKMLNYFVTTNQKGENQ